MRDKTKYIYFFRGTLSSHIGIYKSWVDLAIANGLQMEMLTVLNLMTYIKEYNEVRKYRNINCLRILISPHPIFDGMIISLYFILLSIKYKNIIIHVRKQNPNILDKLKVITKNVIKYIIEIEGDFESEAGYLKAHPYKPGFYDSYYDGAEKQKKLLPLALKKADHILVVTQNLKALFIQRYTGLHLKNKMSVIPTGADANKFYYSREIRNRYRKNLNIENKFVFIFTGNVYYSWQNLKRTLEIFKLLKDKEIVNDPFFLLLIRKQDFNIAQEFIDKIGISKSDYLLTNVNHDEVNGYLNTADVGVLLRDDHIMNHVSSPGKLGEYLSAGLPVLTSRGIADYSEKIQSSPYGVVLNNFNDDDEVITKFSYFLDDNLREKRSEWAKNIFSVQAHAGTYLGLLKSLSV